MSRVMGLIRTVGRSQFAKDFALGAIEDEVKERVGVKAQTGPPTLGGAVASGARAMVKWALDDTLPHTNAQMFAQVRAQGIPMEQAAAVLEQRPERLNNATLYAFMSRGVIDSSGAGAIQRERERSVQRPAVEGLTSEQMREWVAQEERRAAGLAAMTPADIARRASDRE